MDTIKTHWKTILLKIEKNESTENLEIDFSYETLSWKEAMTLGKNGFEIPE